MSENFVTRYQDYKSSGRTVNGRRIGLGIDIDGCVDPGMYKHEPGFAVATIYTLKLQMITPIAMRAWMYVNCYSWDRGVSRFDALCKWADLLRVIPAVQNAGVSIPDFTYLRKWVKITKSLSPEALDAYVKAGDFSGILTEKDSKEALLEEFDLVSKWSKRVNELAKEASENIRAFPYAAQTIRKLHEMGVDLCAVSGTPEDHVIRQLRAYGLLDCFQAVFAQQAGKKNLSLTHMMAGTHDAPDNLPLLNRISPLYDIIAMFGDAPKDYSEAKKANKILSGNENEPVRMFFIKVGYENESWQYFYDHVLDDLIAGTWSRENEQKLIQEGLQNLNRSWTPDIMPIDTFPIKKEEA